MKSPSCKDVSVLKCIKDRHDESSRGKCVSIATELLRNTKAPEGFTEKVMERIRKGE